MVHLVYCDNALNKGCNVLDLIMNKQKRMIARGAAGRKIPHSRVFEGETLYFMLKGSKQVTAKAVVTNVKNYVKLSDEEIDAILEEHQDKLQLSTAQKKRWHRKCLCLVEFDQVESMDAIPFERTNNMDDWIIGERIEDICSNSDNDK